jgi:hypothetical protein
MRHGLDRSQRCLLPFCLVEEDGFDCGGLLLDLFYEPLGVEGTDVIAGRKKSTTIRAGMRLKIPTFDSLCQHCLALRRVN